MYPRWLVHIVLAATTLLTAQASAQTLPPLRLTQDDFAALPLEEPPVIRKPNNILADPYAPLGIRLGTLTLFPSVNLATVSTSNVAKASGAAQDDWGLRLRPGLRWESDWPRHAWTGQATGDFTWYEERNDLDSRQADISGRYRLDIRRFTWAEMESSYSLDQSGIEDSEVPDTAIGNRTDHELASAVALTHDFGPLEARLKAGVSWQIFEDVQLAGGGVENNADRNLVEPALSLRAAYTDPPAVKPFVEAAYRPRIHEKTIDRNGLRRDSQGWSARAGLMLENAPFLSGEAALVYLVRDYEDQALETNQTLGLDANLVWSPTGLTTFTYSAATSLGETVSATSSGPRTWTFGAHMRHALRDNVDLLTGVDAEFEKSAIGTDVTFDANLGLEWALNPSLVWTASYDGTWFNAARKNGDYDEQRVTVGVTLRR